MGKDHKAGDRHYQLAARNDSGHDLGSRKFHGGDSNEVKEWVGKAVYHCHILRTRTRNDGQFPDRSTVNGSRSSCCCNKESSSSDEEVSLSVFAGLGVFARNLTRHLAFRAKTLRSAKAPRNLSLVPQSTIGSTLIARRAGTKQANNQPRSEELQRYERQRVSAGTW